MRANTLVVGRKNLGTIRADLHGMEIILFRRGVNLVSKLSELDSEIVITNMLDGGCAVFIPRDSCQGVLMSKFFKAITAH